MLSLSKWGGLAALYMAAAYAVGIYIFLILLDYPNITGADDRLAVLVAKPGLILITNLILYVAFGVALVVLVAALHDRMKAQSPGLLAVGGALGLIWAGSLIAGGMVSNAGIAPALALQASDPALAAVIWAQTEAVANGLGNGNGEVLGGLMTALLSLAGLPGGGLPRLLVLAGVLIGVLGVATLAPVLVDVTGLFGILQGLWFIGVGVVLLRAA